MKNRQWLSQMAAVAAFGLMIASSYGSVPLRTSADAHVSYTFQNSNYGTNEGLLCNTYFAASAGSNEINKAYLLFDASVFGTNLISEVTGITFLNNLGRTYQFWLIEGTNTDTAINANDWIESGPNGITWANAPGNNGSSYTNPPVGFFREFIAYPGETITYLYAVAATANTPATLTITNGSAEELALLNALNTGDRKATIGVTLNRQAVNGFIRSREQDDGANAVSINVELAADAPAGILRQPRPVTVILGPGPAREATFKVEAYGGGTLTYQWLTNGVDVAGATDTTLVLSGLTDSTLNGTLVSVRVDNEYTADPGVVSDSALLTIVEPDGVIYATSDVFFSGSVIYNAYTDPMFGIEVNYGLTATDNIGATGTNRSYISFPFGTQAVASAKLRLFQYWGGPEVNGMGAPAKGTIRIFGSINELVLTEPPANTAQAWPENPEYAAPGNANFVRVSQGTDQTVGPDIGWYEWDITSFYNQNLGKQTVIRLNGLQASGFDFPLFEDRENTAYNAGAGGTWPNTGPRIEYFYPPPRITGGALVGGQVVLTGGPGKPSATFRVLLSADLGIPLTSWTAVATNQFDANASFSVSIPYDSDESQKFYMLQVP